MEEHGRTGTGGLDIKCRKEAMWIDHKIIKEEMGRAAC